MDLATFRRVLTSFADRSVDIDIGRGAVVAQIRDEIVSATLLEREGTVYVEEDGYQPITAYRWVIDRVARLSLLADRVAEHVPKEEHFVTPSGQLLDDLNEAPSASEDHVTSAADAIVRGLDRARAGMTGVLYLTSDAGEGKTTLINQVALAKASEYKRKTSPWLLVPISLGGRPFMALDDIVVAELSNRYRFLLYYDAFLELVRLNAVVPALDGFEEVFMETGTGEAVSALGNLLNQLNGSGRVLIAARKAYFEIRSFASQARLYDSVRGDSGVTFSRLSLDRWSRSHFEEYARKRGLNNASELYERVAERLRPDHPVLTRAVLVERVVDVAEDNAVEALMERLGSDPEDYFYQFVDTIVERESRKWIDRSRRGDAAVPLLSVAEHHSLLSHVAKEMWITSSDTLKDDYLGLVADIFASDHHKSASETRQIRERLHQHSLLVSVGSRREIGFDHEDFRRFYLGQALGEVLATENQSTILAFLRVGSIPSQTAEAALNVLRREAANCGTIADALTTISRSAADTSYEKENAALLLVRLLEVPSSEDRTVSKLVFPVDALRGRRLRNARIEDSLFQPTALADTVLESVTFDRCSFERLDIGEHVTLNNVVMRDCEVRCLDLPERDDLLFTPHEIRNRLTELGVVLAQEEPQQALQLEDQEVDEDTRRASTVLRAFMRSTHLNENVFRQRLGSHANQFFDDTLPTLLAEGILEEVDYKGGGNQRRFKLGVPMRNIEPAIREARTMAEFLQTLRGD
jgi:hypothetical protein